MNSEARREILLATGWVSGSGCYWKCPRSGNFFTEEEAVALQRLYDPDIETPLQKYLHRYDYLLPPNKRRQFDKSRYL